MLKLLIRANFLNNTLLVFDNCLQNLDPMHVFRNILEAIFVMYILRGAIFFIFFQIVALSQRLCSCVVLYRVLAQSRYVFSSA